MKHLRELRVLKLVLGSHRTWDLSGLRDREAADKIFETLSVHCPHLTIVVFELRRLVGCTTWSFVRSKRPGHYVRAEPLGADVGPYMIKDYKPCSDMLEPEKLILS